MESPGAGCFVVGLLSSLQTSLQFTQSGDTNNTWTDTACCGRPRYSRFARICVLEPTQIRQLYKWLVRIYCFTRDGHTTDIRHVTGDVRRAAIRRETEYTNQTTTFSGRAYFTKGVSSKHSLERTEVLATIPNTDKLAPAYYHSFGISDNYFILFETPERISLLSLIKIFCFSKIRSREDTRDCSAVSTAKETVWLKFQDLDFLVFRLEPGLRLLVSASFNDCMYWDKSLGVNVILFDRINKRRFERKVTSDPFFAFHHANSYEKDGFLVLDYCRIDNPGNFEDLLLEHMRTGSFLKAPGFQPHLHRMIIPLRVNEDSRPGDNLLANCEFASGCQAILKDDGSIHCTDMRLSHIAMEFPRYCYDLNMREYRFVYGSCIVHDENEHPGVVKVDLKTGKSKVWYKDAVDQLCAEPILVNKPNYSNEDEGVLIVPVVTTREDDTPHVVILNAETMEELGRYLIPQPRIPLGFHAHFLAKN